MSQYSEIWPAPCGFAEVLHAAKHGPAPEPLVYQCTDLPVWPPGSSVGLVYLEQMPNTYRLAVTWTLGSPATNLAVTTHDWRWNQEPPPVAADFLGPESKMDAFLLDISVFVSSLADVISYDWHLLAPDGSGPVTGTVHHADKALSFTGSSLLPPQVSCSVTEMTDVRRRWGRFYIPFLSAGVTTTGRLTASIVAAIADAAADLEDLGDPNWTPQVYGAPAPSSIPVRSVRVDDVLDIIRSRRWSSPTVRETRNL